MKNLLPLCTLLLFSLIGWAAAQYHPLHQLSPAQKGQKVRVVGRFNYQTRGQAYFSGQLESGQQWLPVRGQFFDWQPRDNSLVELWGTLKSGNEGLYLDFHNGRHLGEARQPLELTFNEGQRYALHLLVRQTGTAQSPIFQARAEDQSLFWLEQYQGPLGMRCLSGQLSIRQGRYFLSQIMAC